MLTVGQPDRARVLRRGPGVAGGLRVRRGSVMRSNRPRPAPPRVRRLRIPRRGLAPLEVVRGPMLSDQSSGQSLPVSQSLLDMSYGINQGHARIRRDFPMLGKMPPGQIDFPREHVILDGTLWQYPTMGIPNNVTR